jgi:uracil-DNA glycosylase
MLSSQDYHNKIAESALAWWRDAGVDYVSDGEAMNWLAPVATAPMRAEPPKPIEQPRRAVAAPEPAAAPKAARAEWPADLGALKAAIAGGAALPGCSYGSRTIAPTGEQGATAMVIGDFPEHDEVATGDYGSSAAGQLTAKILLAAQILPDFVYRTALAHSIPAAGSLPKDDLAILAEFVRHQIALVQPKIVVLFGSAACEAMLAQELMKARGNLLYINQNDRKTAAIATFHPRTLIMQPQLKVQAWKDLQILARKDYL